MILLRRAALVAGAMYVVALALIVFWPTPVDAAFPREIGWVITQVRNLGWQSFDYGKLQSVSNIVLFLPFGFLAVVLMRARDWWACIVLGVVASALIETGQLLFLGDRYATLADVLTNGIGTVLGVAIGLAAHAVVRGSARLRMARLPRVHEEAPRDTASAPGPMG